MKKSLFIFFAFIFYFSHPIFVFSQTKMLDAKFIADNYYKGVVKILLYDSVAAKKDTNLAYIGRGSGFIVSDDGIIFTNRHVIDMCVYGYAHYDKYDETTNTTSSFRSEYSEELFQDTDIVKINFVSYAAPIVQVYYGKGENDYKLYYAKVLSVSMGSFDGAMLKIVSDLNGNPVKEHFLALPIGNSDSTFQGEDLCVYGFPEQYQGDFDMMLKNTSTLTFGKHSGFDFVYNKDFGYIKTEASINRGNSGGPVFNADEKIIGIATAAFTETNTGLVGGINGMYYVAASDIEILQKLSAKGLKVPRNAGSIKTVNGEHKPVFSQTQIDAINKKKQADFEARLKRIELQKRAEAISYMPKAKIALVNLGVDAGAGHYSRGNLNTFWQTINENAAPAFKENPFCWSAYFQMMGANKKETNFFGLGMEYSSTSKNAIHSENKFDNVTNSVSVNLKTVNFQLPYYHRIAEKHFLVIEPGITYTYWIRGSVTAYGSTYNEKNELPFGVFSWYLSGGDNWMVSKSIGISFRAGYRQMVTPEEHLDARTLLSSTTYSFFADAANAETTKINWSGFYATAGIFFSSGILHKTKHTKKEKK